MENSLRLCLGFRRLRTDYLRALEPEVCFFLPLIIPFLTGLPSEPRPSRFSKTPRSLLCSSRQTLTALRFGFNCFSQGTNNNPVFVCSGLAIRHSQFRCSPWKTRGSSPWEQFLSQDLERKELQGIASSPSGNPMRSIAPCLARVLRWLSYEPPREHFAATFPLLQADACMFVNRSAYSALIGFSGDIGAGF